MPARKLLLGVLFVLILLQGFAATGNEFKKLQADVQREANPEIPTVTRAEAVMVLLLSRVPRVADVRNDGRFRDVEPGSWYERYLVMAERYRIISADSGLRLHPENPVSRAEFLKMMTLTFGLSENLPYLYSDVPALAWYARYAGIAQHYNLFPKDIDRLSLSPLARLTHAETAEAIQSMLIQWEKERSLLTTKKAEQVKDGLPKPMLITSTKTERFTRVNMDWQGPAYWTARPQTSWRPFTQEDVEVQKNNIIALRTELARLTNEARRHAGLQELRYDISLELTAQKYAEDMAKRDFFSHVSPEGKGLKARMAEADFGSARYDPVCHCIARVTIGENLARGQRTPAEVMAAWLRSASHREAILNPDFRELGIGVQAGVWVQHFGGTAR